MFTIKVTFRGQIRKLTFNNTNTFPPYNDICDQLSRVFSISSSLYFVKLLLSPDASQPSRILIGKEVYNAYDYARCIRPFKNRTWPNALLRFTVCESASGPAASVRSISATHVAQSFDSNPEEVSMFHNTSRSLSFPTGNLMDVDCASVTLSNQSTPKLPAQAEAPTAQSENLPSATASCCSVSQGKAEIRAMLDEFQDVLERVVNHDLATPEQNASAVPVMEAPPPSLCSLCTKSAAGAPDGIGSWYSCESCHVVTCSDCHSKERPSFCLNLMGPHQMKLTITSSGQDSGPPIPHLPSPWTPRLFEGSSNLAFASAATPVKENVEPSHAQGLTTVPSVIHRGVVCDSCNATIEGVRHKCLDCPNYDLCTPCISVGCAEAHNPFHEFFDITEPGRVIVHNVFSGNGGREIPRQRRRTATSTRPTVHLATCDLCDSRILGDRFKCMNCPDFDTCEACYSITGEQHPKHNFVRIHKPEDYLRPHSETRQMHYATCDACSKRIYGIRYKCMHPECPDYDLCENCEALPISVHPENHPMLKMKASDTVIPTVYRVGQTTLIPTAQFSVSKEGQPDHRSTSPLPLHHDSPMPLTFPTSSGERARTPTPVIRAIPEVDPAVPALNSPIITSTSPVGPPPLPPKPEMMWNPSWASIPGIFWPSQWDQTNPGISVPASLKDPFADIAIPETPMIPAISSPPVPQAELEELQQQYHRVPSPKISLPSVPRHIPNPWPTTNAAERQELLQLIADSAGPSTSPDVLNTLSEPSSDDMRSIEDKKKWINVLLPSSHKQAAVLPPPSTTPLDDCTPVNSDPWPKFPEVTLSDDSAKKNDNRKDSLSPDDRINAGFDEFSMPHLLEGLEQRVASLAVEPKPTSSITGSISDEALLRRPSPEISPLSPGSQRPQADLINYISSPPAVSLQETKEGDVKPQMPLSALFIEDVTVPDGQIFPPGAEFMKCWRLSNTGNRDWPDSTELVFVAGESLSSGAKSSMSVGLGKVTAGAEVEVWSGELKAPDAPGSYVGYWRLKADGEVFGDSLWIEINVVEADSLSSEESMASSSVVMPTASSAAQSQRVASTTVHSASVPTDLTSTEDNISDPGSDVSLISMPSSPSLSDDEAMWHDTRSHATSDMNAAGAVAGAPAGPNDLSAIDYVLLYDDSSSSEE